MIIPYTEEFDNLAIPGGTRRYTVINGVLAQTNTWPQFLSSYSHGRKDGWKQSPFVPTGDQPVLPYNWDKTTSGEISGNFYSYVNAIPNSVAYVDGCLTQLVLSGGFGNLYYGSLAVPRADSGRGQQLALAKLDAIAKIEKPSYNLGESALEIRETLALLRNPIRAAKEIAQGYEKALLRYNPSGGSRRRLALDITCAQAQAYLGINFAWRPIFDDIFKALSGFEEFLRKTPKQPALQKATATATYGYTVSSSTARYGSANWYVPVTSSYTLEGSVQCGLLYRVRDLTPPSFRETIALDDLHLPGAVWAVLPLTWVTDQFLDISKSLGALAALASPGLEIVDGWVTDTTSAVTTALAGDIVKTYTTSTEHLTANPYQTHRRVMTRQRWHVTPWDAAPVPKLPFDVTSLTNDLALIVAKLTKR